MAWAGEPAAASTGGMCAKAAHVFSLVPPTAKHPACATRLPSQRSSCRYNMATILQSQPKSGRSLGATVLSHGNGRQ